MAELPALAVAATGGLGGIVAAAAIVVCVGDAHCGLLFWALGAGFWMLRVEGLFGIRLVRELRSGLRTGRGNEDGIMEVFL